VQPGVPQQEMMVGLSMTKVVEAAVEPHGSAQLGWPQQLLLVMIGVDAVTTLPHGSVQDGMPQHDVAAVVVTTCTDDVFTAVPQGSGHAGWPQQLADVVITGVLAAATTLPHGSVQRG